MSDKVTVFKVDYEEFLKWCKKEELPTTTLEELGRAIDAYILEAVRIKTKYVN